MSKNTENSTEAMSLRQKILAISREVAPIQKTGDNPHFKSKYIELNGILDALDPLLLKYGVGLELDQAPYQSDCEGITITVFDVQTNEEKTYTKYVPLNRPDAQAVGSADTYLRRYLLVIIFNLQASDDDGNAASPSNSPSASKSYPTSRPATVPVTPKSTKADEEAALEMAAQWGFDKDTVLRWQKNDPSNRAFSTVIKYPNRFEMSLKEFKDAESVY